MEDGGRRKFLGLCLGGMALVAAGAVAYPLFRYLAPLKTQGPTGKVSIPEKDIAPGAAKFFEFNGITAVAVHTRNAGFIVLSAVCTHLGCIVQWEKDKQQFLCPCHAGRYTEGGEVLGGPPPKPLPRLPFTVADGTIIVG